jgi:hypothetical protein
MPTAICLTSPRPLDDCSVVGHILIEDLDYPELKCGSSKTNDLEKYSSQLSEYRCHIQKGTETLRNKVMVNENFYIQHSPPILFVKKTIFTHGDASYDVPIVCRSTIHPLHTFSKTLNVNIKGKQSKRYLETFNTGRFQYALQGSRLARPIVVLQLTADAYRSKIIKIYLLCFHRLSDLTLRGAYCSI